MSDKTARILGAVALAVALIFGVIGLLRIQDVDPIARSYQCEVYTEQGCAKFVVASGGEIEVQSGGTLDVQSGATAGYGGNLLITGTLDVDGAATLNSTLDVDGAISSGTGAVTVSDSIDVSGAATLNSTLDVDGAISSGTGSVTVTDDVDISGALEFGAGDLSALAFDGSTQYEFYFGNASTVTNTVIQSDTHNMITAADWAICYVSDPDEDAGDPFLCIATISGSDVTFQALQDDGEIATTTATTLYYLIVGR